MKKPIIGLTPIYDEDKKCVCMRAGYMEVIEAAGGIPIMLSLANDTDQIEGILDICDGIVFTGGHDVHPNIYKEEKLDICDITHEGRDRFEQALFMRAFEEDKPILGICRGIQIINALLGGTLWQDIAVQKGEEIAQSHRMPLPYNTPWHKVSLVKETPLYDLLKKETLEVNSYHHQGIKTLADSLACMAIAEDGLIEAVYCPGKRFVQAIQWHPETLWEAEDDALRIVENFVKHCAKSE